MHNLAHFSLKILRVGAIYTPQREISRNIVGEPREVELPEISAVSTNYAQGDPLDRCGTGGPDTTVAIDHNVVCQARRALRSYRIQLVGSVPALRIDGAREDTPGGTNSANSTELRSPERGDLAPSDPDARTVDREKAQRSRISSCLSAMNRLRMEAGIFSENLEQAHFQVRQHVCPNLSPYFSCAGVTTLHRRPLPVTVVVHHE